MLSHKKLEINFRVMRILFVCQPNLDLCLFSRTFGGSCRVILVVAFGFFFFAFGDLQLVFSYSINVG